MGQALNCAKNASSIMRSVIIMFKDLTKFQKGCLVVTVLETIVIYGGLALVSRSLNKELKEKENVENELQQLALKEANEIKSL